VFSGWRIDSHVSVIFGIFVKSSMLLQKQNCICIIKREIGGRRRGEAECVE
jgi:hypothetical protein